MRMSVVENGERRNFVALRREPPCNDAAPIMHHDVDAMILVSEREGIDQRHHVSSQRIDGIRTRTLQLAAAIVSSLVGTCDVILIEHTCIKDTVP